MWTISHIVFYNNAFTYYISECLYTNSCYLCVCVCNLNVCVYVCTYIQYAMHKVGMCV